jgi:hypothetical protein
MPHRVWMPLGPQMNQPEEMLCFHIRRIIPQNRPAFRLRIGKSSRAK